MVAVARGAARRRPITLSHPATDGGTPVAGEGYRDAPADAVLLSVNPPLLSLRQMPIMRSHVRLLAVLHGRLTLFQMRGLLRSQSPICNTIPDAFLLMRLAAVDLVHSRMSRIMNARPCTGSVVGCGLRSSGTDKHQSPHRKNCEHVADFVRHADTNPRP